MESIKRARKRQGLSLTDVATRSGVPRTSVARAERAGCSPALATLRALAAALAMPICELIDEDVSHEQHTRQQSGR